MPSYMCSITPEMANVGSSYSHTRDPSIDCWFSSLSNCSHWCFKAAVLSINPTDQWEPIVVYHSIILLVFTQLCSPRCWHLDSSYRHTRCRRLQLRFVLSPLHLHLLAGSNPIFHFSRWLGQLSTVLTTDESPHTGYIFRPWVLSFTPT